jgi:hypothetical protein
MRVYITDKKHCCISSLVERIEALLHFEWGYCAVNIWRGLYVLAKTVCGCLAIAHKLTTIVGVYLPLSAAELSFNRGATMENMEKTLANCPCFIRQGELFA